MLDAQTHDSAGDIVLIHGAGGNNLLWSRVLQHLTGDRRAYALNLPGHPSGDITCTTVREYSDAVLGFISDASLQRPAVCGHSMGSAVALTLAIEHPEAVGSLVLVGSGAKLGVDPKIVEGLKGQPLAAIEQIITPRSFYSIDLGLGRDARAALSVSNLPVFLNDYLACQGFDVRGALHRILCRTLILCGDKDQLTPPKWAHYLQQNILGSQLLFVADSGHMLPLEKPATSAALIQSFLQTSSR